MTYKLLLAPGIEPTDIARALAESGYGLSNAPTDARLFVIDRLPPGPPAFPEHKLLIRQAT